MKRKGAIYRIEYGCWRSMRDRCLNPRSRAYKKYGGRGITICDRWINSFWDFLDDVGPRPSKDYSLDRFPDNNGNYEPNNIRWATVKEQSTNRSSNRIIEYNGLRKTVTQWSEELGSRDAVSNRLRDGWDEQKAVSVPIEFKFGKGTSQDIIDNIVKLRDGGKKFSAIGKELKINRSFVRTLYIRGKHKS